jgi:NADPH:quinone reductase-like Zn-dependent oxidoreductase
MQTDQTSPVPASPGTAGGPTTQSIMQDRYADNPEGIFWLADIPRPTPGAGQVLVRVQATSIDRGTWHVMAGLPYLIRAAGFGLRRPKYANPGRSLAGTVEAAGADVIGFRPGDRVYGIGIATFAGHALAPAEKLAPMPARLTFNEAAAVPVSGLTALQGLRDRGGVKPGQTVLILGASGGVGSFAVQIAKAFGAEVTGVCSTSKMEMVRSLGADRVLDYTVDDLDAAKRYDLILDIGGHRSLRTLRRALAPGGTLVIVGSETGGRWLGGFDRSIRAMLLNPFVGQRLAPLTVSENATDLSVLAELIDAGQLAPVVDHTYPLEDVGAAIRRLLEGKASGKLVLSISHAGAHSEGPRSTE